MKKTGMAACAAACLAAAVAFAQGPIRAQQRTAGASVQHHGRETVHRRDNGGRVVIDTFPKLGRQATLSAPSFNGESIVGKTYLKPRRWIVLEAKYTTFAKWQDQLTFTWHVLLETKTATEKDKSDKIAPYSYFTTSVTYQNIPQGSHTASVCLHPSNLERYGEPRAVGLVITSKNGETLAGGCDSGIPGISANLRDPSRGFWNNSAIMGKKTSAGEPLIERRQGLVDRSKTIWALVNPNDYEQTAP